MEWKVVVGFTLRIRLQCQSFTIQLCGFLTSLSVCVSVLVSLSISVYVFLIPRSPVSSVQISSMQFSCDRVVFRFQLNRSIDPEMLMLKFLLLFYVSVSLSGFDSTVLSIILIISMVYNILV